MLFSRKPLAVPAPDQTLPGRDAAIPTAVRHAVNGTDLKAPLADGQVEIVVALGCFWGAERLFWQLPGVVSTSVGYAGGTTPNPTYSEVCSGRTGHTEVVRVVYDPSEVTLDALLKTFWEGHDPTQGMRQGNDVGTQYRSAIYTSSDEQLAAAKASKAAYEVQLKARGFGPITTEIAPAGPYYYAEADHQQYLHKNPRGYCGLGGTGVACPIGVGVEAAE